MAKKSDKDMIVGLDIGTSKVVAIVGEVSDSGQIEIIGIGSNSSRGMKKYALLRAASFASRPDTNTAEHRIFANPASPSSVRVPFGV